MTAGEHNTTLADEALRIWARPPCAGGCGTPCPWDFADWLCGDCHADLLAYAASFGNDQYQVNEQGGYGIPAFRKQQWLAMRGVQP